MHIRISYFNWRVLHCIPKMIEEVAMRLDGYIIMSLNVNFFRITGPFCGWTVNSPHKGQ